MKYHYVCHDCTDEALIDDRGEAIERFIDHTDETDHRCDVVAVHDY